MRLSDNGSQWEVELQLPAGKYAFKFLLVFQPPPPAPPPHPTHPPFYLFTTHNCRLYMGIQQRVRALSRALAPAPALLGAHPNSRHQRPVIPVSVRR
jgi:hypothetical protein